MRRPFGFVGLLLVACSAEPGRPLPPLNDATTGPILAPAPEPTHPVAPRSPTVRSPAPEHRACTTDADCVVTSWDSCCSSCPCIEPYPVARRALEQWQSACNAVDCPPPPESCPPCGSSTVGASTPVACVESLCVLVPDAGLPPL